MTRAEAIAVLELELVGALSASTRETYMLECWSLDAADSEFRKLPVHLQAMITSGTHPTDFASPQLDPLVVRPGIDGNYPEAWCVYSRTGRMHAMRIAVAIELTAEVRATLTRLATSRRSQVRVAERARIVLLAADGWQNNDIAKKLGTTEKKVGRWRARFAERGMRAIEKDLPRGGRTPAARAKFEPAIIERTTQSRPENATHWSVRTLAAELKTTRSMVHRVWRANGLKPHLTRTFKISNDPNFEEKVVDVVGLYLNPPDNALVLSVDEKSGCQALDRTQPSLPIYPGRCGTMTHDYKRNGTTTFFAAMEMAEGRVIAQCLSRNRHQDFLAFLKTIDRETTPNLDLHLILDNLATHKHPTVRAWLVKHPRFHLHFIPTSSSWLNVVEIFLRELTNKRLRRGAFTSVAQLEQAIMSYVDGHNVAPEPYVWTARADAIIEKVGRAKAALKMVKQRGTDH